MFESIPPGKGRWKSDDYPLCQVNISAAVLAQTVDAPLSDWWEDGLGNASGFGGLIPSGHMILVQELEALTQRAERPTTIIYVDAEDFNIHGLDKLLAEVSSLFGLSTNELTWIQAKRLINDHDK